MTCRDFTESETLEGISQGKKGLQIIAKLDGLRTFGDFSVAEGFGPDELEIRVGEVVLLKVEQNQLRDLVPLEAELRVWVARILRFHY